MYIQNSQSARKGGGAARRHRHIHQEPSPILIRFVMDRHGLSSGMAYEVARLAMLEGR